MVPSPILRAHDQSTPPLHWNVNKLVGVPIPVSEADPEVCGWSCLPPELKEIIWGQCSVPQLARVATTCREFCTHLRTLRSTLKTLTVPPGKPRLAVVENESGHNDFRLMRKFCWAISLLCVSTSSKAGPHVSPHLRRVVLSPFAGRFSANKFSVTLLLGMYITWTVFGRAGQEGVGGHGGGIWGCHQGVCRQVPGRLRPPAALAGVLPDCAGQVGLF